MAVWTSYEYWLCATNIFYSHTVSRRNIARKICVNCTHGKCINVFDVLNVLNVLNVLDQLDLLDLLDIFDVLCILET